MVHTPTLQTLPEHHLVHVSACSVCVYRSLLALSFALIHASEPKVSLYIILAVSAYATFVLGVVRPLWWKVVDRVRQCTYLCICISSYVCIYTTHTLSPLLSHPPPHAPFPACLCVCVCDSRWMTRARTRFSLVCLP